MAPKSKYPHFPSIPSNITNFKRIQRIHIRTCFFECQKKLNLQVSRENISFTWVVSLIRDFTIRDGLNFTGPFFPLFCDSVVG